MHVSSCLSEDSEYGTYCRTGRLLLYLGLSYWGSSLSRDSHTSLSQDTRPVKRHSPSRVSWLIPRATSWWDVPKTPPEGGTSDKDVWAITAYSSWCEQQLTLLRAYPKWLSSSTHLKVIAQPLCGKVWFSISIFHIRYRFLWSSLWVGT